MMSPAESDTAQREVTLGRIVGVFGVKGWVKVKSYTEPAEGILDYGAWHLLGPGAARATVRPLEGRRHGTLVVARLEGVSDRMRRRRWRIATSRCRGRNCLGRVRASTTGPTWKGSRW